MANLNGIYSAYYVTDHFHRSGLGGAGHTMPHRHRIERLVRLLDDWGEDC